MKHLSTVLAAGALVVMGTFLALPRRATAEKPTGCQQWEVMSTPTEAVVLDAKNLPRADRGFVEKSPAGWEPFAFGPTGLLVHRRCAK